MRDCCSLPDKIPDSKNPIAIVWQAVPWIETILSQSPSADKHFYPGQTHRKITITAPGAANSPSTVQVTLVVIPALVITTTCPVATVQTGSVLAPFPLTATGEVGGYTFSVIGNLPASLTVTGNVISGPVTVAPGSYPFTLQVTSGTQTVQKACSITVTSPTLQITSACPATAQSG